MTDAVPIPSIAGRLSSIVGLDLRVAIFGSAERLLEFFPTVKSAPTTAPCVIELRAPAGTLAASIPVGENSPASPASGLIDIQAGEVLDLRVTADGGARELDGWFRIEKLAAAAPTVALTTLADVKLYGKIENSDSDTLLQNLIDRTSDAIHRYIDVNIPEWSVADELHDGGWSYVVPKHFPVTTVTQVEINGSVVDAADYRVGDSQTRIEFVSGWRSVTVPRGRQNIKIDYDAGYATIPGDVTHAATLQTLREFQRTQPGGVANLGIERATASSGGDTEWQTGLFTPEVEKILAPYRRAEP